MDAGAKVRRAQARGRTLGASLFGYFFAGPAFRCLKKVTRCKSGTIGGRDRSNGYALGQSTTSSALRRLREQARSHKGTGYSRNLLAMDRRTLSNPRLPASSLTTIASELRLPPAQNAQPTSSRARPSAATSAWLRSSNAGMYASGSGKVDAWPRKPWAAACRQ